MHTDGREAVCESGRRGEGRGRHEQRGQKSHLADDRRDFEVILLLLGPLVVHVVDHALLLLLPLATAARRLLPDAAAGDARVAVLEIVRRRVRLEQQRLQLEEVGLAVRLRHREALLAQQLVLPQLVDQLVAHHALQLGVARRQRDGLEPRQLLLLGRLLGPVALELGVALRRRHPACRDALLRHCLLHAPPGQPAQHPPLLLALLAAAHELVRVVHRA
mmetsp:Transcript_35568/g.107110  ORF Transcript_35568/g.107110 Transcript_35568/m.107110 type:complete len:219 (-) Transcript_35568:3502-4158(-)